MPTFVNFRGFDKRTEFLAAEFVAKNRGRLGRTTVAVVNALVDATPVDTGYHRNSWLTSKEGPLSGDRLDNPDRNGTAARQQAADVARTVGRDARGRFVKGEITVHITNNARAIELLNKGSSRQAPAGFIEKAVLAATRTR